MRDHFGGKQKFGLFLATAYSRSEPYSRSEVFRPAFWPRPTEEVGFFVQNARPFSGKQQFGPVLATPYSRSEVFRPKCETIFVVPVLATPYSRSEAYGLSAQVGSGVRKRFQRGFRRVLVKHILALCAVLCCNFICTSNERLDETPQHMHSTHVLSFWTLQAYRLGEIAFVHNTCRTKFLSNALLVLRSSCKAYALLFLSFVGGHVLRCVARGAL